MTRTAGLKAVSDPSPIWRCRRRGGGRRPESRRAGACPSQARCFGSGGATLSSGPGVFRVSSATRQVQVNMSPYSNTPIGRPAPPAGGRRERPGTIRTRTASETGGPGPDRQGGSKGDCPSLRPPRPGPESPDRPPPPPLPRPHRRAARPVRTGAATRPGGGLGRTAPSGSLSRQLDRASRALASARRRADTLRLLVGLRVAGGLPRRDEYCDSDWDFGDRDAVIDSEASRATDRHKRGSPWRRLGLRLGN